MLLYLYKTNQYVGKYGYLYSPQEVAEADILERNWAHSKQSYSLSQLLNIFPEAKPAVIRNLKQEIKQCKDDLVKAEEARVKFNNDTLSRVNHKDKGVYSFLRDTLYVEPITEGRLQKIKHNKFLLSMLTSQSKIDPNRITERDIALAKNVPLETFYTGNLRKNGTNFLGLCPFHNDRNPSFVIYTKTNRFWCYGCLSGGDTINFISKTHNCNFLTAIKIILNK